MGDAQVAYDTASATYEIQLEDAPPDTLVARFAPSHLRRNRAQTLLMGRVTSQDELAQLLERVLTMGLVLNEVHELRVTSSPPRSSRPETGRRSVDRAYEVRVDGALDATLLRILKWPHRHLPEQEVLRLEGNPEHVHEFLKACCLLGLGIQRVRRVTSGCATVPSAADQGQPQAAVATSR